jgi:nucleoside-diphosphate-sugar epimerase
MDWTHARIFIAGHHGMVGRALVRALERKLSAGEKFDIVTRTRAETDLSDSAAVRAFFEQAQRRLMLSWRRQRSAELKQTVKRRWIFCFRI